jgi:hypothetical protein
MNTIHPDHASHQIQGRQEIVRDGIRAARRPGDAAAIRDVIGQMLIHAGERIRGHQHRASLPVPLTGRVTQLAR